MDEKSVREHLSKALSWGEAHVNWKFALDGVPEKLWGLRTPGASHSLWEILEHSRIAQRDILEFSRDAKHVSPDWPSGYWPKESAPQNAGEWEKSVRDFEKDLVEFEKLVADSTSDLTRKIPHGSGQTILRQVLLLADHNAYHLGQFVLVRRLLGSWEAS